MRMFRNRYFTNGFPFINWEHLGRVSGLFPVVMVLLTGMQLAHASGQTVEKQDSRKPDLNYDELNPEAWGIHNGCIQVNRIDRFSFITPHTAKITLVGKKSVIMTFKNRCTGLRNNAIVYETRTGKLCAGFDNVKVMDIGTVCLIESIEPFVDVDKSLDEENPE